MPLRSMYIHYEKHIQVLLTYPSENTRYLTAFELLLILSVLLAQNKSASTEILARDLHTYSRPAIQNYLQEVSNGSTCLSITASFL